MTRGAITVLYLSFVSTVGANLGIGIRTRQGIAEICRLESEGLLEGIGATTSGDIAGPPTKVPLILGLIRIRGLSQFFLEEGGDEVDNTLELLVALLLGILQPAGDMALDKGHGDGV